MNQLDVSRYPNLRRTAIFFSAVAFLISVTYTVMFNIAQSHTLLDKVLAGATGFVQDSTEIIIFAVAYLIWTAKGKKSFMEHAIAFSCVILSLSLVAWSIASTWGANNAMIGSSMSAANYEREKLNLIKSSAALNSSASQSMQANAEALRKSAEDRGRKYATKAASEIQKAQSMSERAATMATKNLTALSELNNIDRDLIASVNSADAAFDRISQALEVDKNVVGTTFLLTRAGQLELIGIIFGIVALFLTPTGGNTGRRNTEKNDTAKGDTAEKLSAPPFDTGSKAKTSTAKKQKEKPVPVQKEGDTEDKEALYQDFVSAAQSGKFKTGNTDFNVRQYKEWLMQRDTEMSSGSAQDLGKDWINRAGKEGKFKRNPRKKNPKSRMSDWAIA